MSLGMRLRERRRELGWSQEELARRLHVRQNVISRLESGTVQSPNITMLRRLAQTLNVTADYLVGMYDDLDGARPPLGATTLLTPEVTHA